MTRGHSGTSPVYERIAQKENTRTQHTWGAQLAMKRIANVNVNVYVSAKAQAPILGT